MFSPQPSQGTDCVKTGPRHGVHGIAIAAMWLTAKGLKLNEGQTAGLLLAAVVGVALLDRAT